MIDLDGNGFALTGAQEGVAFDLIPDRLPDRTAWTERGRLDAFLALDRNANGVVESGVELFGNYTRLSNGSFAPHGFVALAEYDTPQLGGNGDSQISAADAVFDWLRLWIDLNHDGQTQSGELRTLRSAGIVALETNYVETRRQDEHGNQFRFKGKAWKQGRRGAVIPAEMYDVFLAQAP